MNTQEIKNVFIWSAGIMILFYWMMVIMTSTYPGMIFELSVTLLVAERVIDLYEWIYKTLNYTGFERRKDSDEQ